MSIRVCVAGATGWAGSAIVKGLLASDKFELVGAVARQHASEDAGEAIGLPRAGVPVSATFEERSSPGRRADRLHPAGLREGPDPGGAGPGVRVVVGTSGLTADDYAEIEQAAGHAGWA